MFLTSSETFGRPVASVDGAALRHDPAVTRMITEAYESAPWEEI